MDIEIGIQNVARTVTFTTDEAAETVTATIDRALEEHKPIVLTDNKDRRIIVPADSLGCVIVGSEQRHAVGFGNLG